MSARHPLDATTIAQIKERLSPEVCAEIVRIHAQIFIGFPVIEFWRTWLGGWGAGGFTDGFGREAWAAADAAWTALEWQDQDDELTAAETILEHLRKPILPPPEDEDPPAATADDALLDEAWVLMMKGHKAWAAAGQVAPRAAGVGDLDSRRRRLWRVLKRREKAAAV